MAVFIYKAVSGSGAVTTGELEAGDRGDALRQLDRKGLQPVKLTQSTASGRKEEKKGKPAGKPAAAKPARAAKNAKVAEEQAVPEGPIKLKRAQVVMFTEELSDMLGAGLQLEPALRAMESRQESGNLKVVSEKIRQDVRDGSSFSNALRKASPSFGGLYCSLAAAGEASGALHTILKRQAQYLKRLQEIQGVFAVALIYPTILMLSGVIVAVIFVTKLIPQLTALLESTPGAELPGGAKILIAASGFLQKWWIVLALLVVAGLVLFKAWKDAEANKPKWDRIQIRLPLFGPEWGEVIELEEDNWYFKLSEHAGWLREVVASGQFGIEPEFRRAEVLNAVERAADTDLCISRPKERLHWGIEIPFDPDFVTYVWFDALINYISFAGYRKDPRAELPDFGTLWPARSHVIGKDILVPAHSIYWPCMLHAMGFPDEEMPTLLVHGWWNIKGEKMSKSLGNVVDPDELADRFGVDALRYYLVRDIVSGKDSDFDPERLVMLFNTELANDLGNLLNRSLNMTKRFLGGTLAEPAWENEETEGLRDSLARATASYARAMDACEVSAALKALNAHVTHCNGFAERNKPWELAKDESRRDQLASVLYHLCESCLHLAVLLAPVLPAAAGKIFGQLQFPGGPDLKLGDLAWGLLPAGHQTGKPKPVFPRIEVAEEQ